MSGEVLSSVSAVVPPEREGDLVASYREVVALPLPEGLIRTELLHGEDGRWCIQSLWRDSAALEAVRSAPGGPVAPRLFRQVGADPQLTIYRATARRYAPTDGDWAAT